MGDRYFDLGNLSINNGLRDEDDERLLTAYFDAPCTKRRLACLRLMRIMSDFREAMWAGARRGLDAQLDYAQYAARHFARLEKSAADARYPAWLSRPVPADLPGQARCVIIGGLSGASIAYHLAGLGWTDVVLLERADLTSGSTHHSAGFVGQLRASVSLTRMMMYGVELYRRLEREAAVPPGGERPAASAWPRVPSASRSCAGRQAGPAPSGCRWS